MGNVIQFPTLRKSVTRREGRIVDISIPLPAGVVCLSGLDLIAFLKLQQTLNDLKGIRPTNDVLATHEKMLRGYSELELVEMVNGFERSVIATKPLFYAALLDEVRRRSAQKNVKSGAATK